MQQRRRHFNSMRAEWHGDEAGGETYDHARVELAADPQRSVDANRLHPGMQAEVMIVTGERTAPA